MPGDILYKISRKKLTGSLTAESPQKSNPRQASVSALLPLDTLWGSGHIQFMTLDAPLLSLYSGWVVAGICEKE